MRPAPWRLPLAAAEEALSTCRRRRLVTLVTVLVIGTGSSFPLAAVVGLGHLQEGLRRLSRSATVRVVLGPEVGREAARELARAASAVPGVGRVSVVSRREATTRFLGTYPELADALGPDAVDELGLPASLEIVPSMSSSSGSSSRTTRASAVAAALAAELGEVDGVEAVQHDERWARQVERVVAACRAARWGTSAAALAVAAVVVGASVGLGAVGRREELSVLRLIGAPRMHLRGAFWLEGWLQGVAGAALAVALVHAAGVLLGGALQLVLPGAAAGVPMATALGALAAGAATGALGAGTAGELVLRRHARLER